MNNNQNEKVIGSAQKFLKDTGIDPQNINKEKANAILNGLRTEDQNKINNLLKDKKALEEILSSDKAKAIMKLFGAK